MKSYNDLPLEAALAIAEQKYTELIKFRPLDKLVAGDRGNIDQAKNVSALLSSLYSLCRRIESELSKCVREEKSVLSLTPSHAEFLHSTLLPNIVDIKRACFYDDPFYLEVIEWENEPEPILNYSRIKDAISFTAEYTDLMMLDHDDEDINFDRRLKVETVFGIVNQPWFQPDLWSANLDSIRPIVLGKEGSKIPHRIHVRMSEMHRAFVFGSWMATIALCRAVIEFALIERAPNLGYKATQRSTNDTDEYLKLDKLIHNAIAVFPDLKPDLRKLQDAGNTILHPKKRKNVIPLPKIMRSEALSCVQSATHAIELLYARQKSK